MMSNKYKSRLMIFFLATFMVIGLGQPAGANLTGVGGIDPVTEFPVWFRGNNGAGGAGTSLALCIEGGTVAEEPPCLLALADPAGGAVAANIVEALYYGATAAVVRGTERFLAICAVEAAGPGGPAGSVSNVALVRLRNLPVAGNYSVKTPCGNFTLTVTDPAVDTDLTEIVSTLGTAPTFAATLTGPVQMFAENGTALPTFPGYLGDGITPGPLSGPLSPEFGRTTFEVTGPAGFVPFSTNQFTVVGKLFALAPLGERGRVTFTRNAAGVGTLDFLLPKSPGAITAQAVGVGTPLPTVEPLQIPLVNGAFKASLPLTAADTLPATVEVTFNLGVLGETTEIFPVVEKPTSLFLMLPKKKKE